MADMTTSSTAEVYRVDITLHRDVAITPELNLIKRSLDELDFLETVNSLPVLSDETVLDNAIRRYEQSWMPLASTIDGDAISEFASPLDVHWVWHCHLLAPHNYENDCARLTGKVLDHVVRSKSDLVAWHQKTEPLWRQRYPDAPFEVDLSDRTKLSIGIRYYQPICSYGVIRQLNFFYQVSLPHFRCHTFLKNFINRYKKFLFLRKCKPDALLVPCYDIDLI